MLNRTSLAKEKRFLVAMLLVVSLLAAFVLPASAQEVVPPSSEVTDLADNPHMSVSSDGLVGDALVDALMVDAFAPAEQPSFEGEKT